MAMPTPEEAAAKWAQNFGSSGQRWLSGVQSVKAPPGQAAARQKQLYLTNVTASVDRWARNVAAVSAQQWAADCEAKGLPRFSSGATAGQAKYAAIAGRLFQHIGASVAALPPRGDIEANINRSAQFARAMAKFKTG